MIILEPMAEEVGFATVLRGYDRAQVDTMVERVRTGLDNPDPGVRGQLAELLRRPGFAIVLRGYDRRQVDAYLAHILGILDRA